MRLLSSLHSFCFENIVLRFPGADKGGKGKGKGKGKGEGPRAAADPGADLKQQMLDQHAREVADAGHQIEINRIKAMKKKDLVQELKDLNLDDAGTQEAKQERLIAHYKTAAAPPPPAAPPPAAQPPLAALPPAAGSGHSGGEVRPPPHPAARAS